MKLTLARSYARKMRQNPTKAEAFFWEKCRAKRLGDFKFRRQHIFQYRDWQNKLACFIVDFYCHEEQLVIEVDGAYHQRVDQQTIDGERDAILRDSFGLEVLRFSNEEVLEQWERVAERVKLYLREGG